MPKTFLAALLLLQPALFAQPQNSSENDRLLATGKLWATVKYFHPYLAYRDLDWDKALVDALPQIRSASTAAGYAAALQSMLDRLDDPATDATIDTPARSPASLHIENRPDGTLLVSQTESAQSAADPLQQLTQALASATRVIFDLRVERGAPDLLSGLLEDDSVSGLLARTALDGPAHLSWVHRGLPVQSPSPSAYYTAFFIKPGIHIEGSSAAPERRAAFILNGNSPLPHIGCALWAQGKTTVLSESKHAQFADVESVVIPMGLGVEAFVRLSEPVISREVKSVAHDAALAQAAAALAGPNVPLLHSPLPASPSPPPERSYSATPYPSTEYRILAAYKIWAVVHNFFAYKDLMDQDWDDLFASYLPKFIAAKDAREYHLTVAEMIAHLVDSQASIHSEELDTFFGKAPVGLRVRLVEKKPVITEVLDQNATHAGIHPGDIITEMDGESIADRFHREERYIASSTSQWLGYRIMQRLLNGPENSTASLAIQTQRGQIQKISLKRSTSYNSVLAEQRSGDVVKLLSGNLGYADLDRLPPEQADNMMGQFRSTKAIIFDLRGSSRGTVEAIAARLTDREDVAAAIFTGPLSLSPDLPSPKTLTSSASYFAVQKISPAAGWKYKSKTVMLIDERTVSQAEHAGLLLEAANKTEFIGTPSAGADGAVSNFLVPGGITIQFSGQDVRHGNGGQLQRLGLQPALTVAPTVEGVRGGRDEVLEKAVEYLSQ